MKTHNRCILIAPLIVAGLSAAGLAADPSKAASARDALAARMAPAPQGTYRVVELILEPGLPDRDRGHVLRPRQRLHLIFRDSKLVNVWSIPTRWRFIRIVEAAVTLDAESLQGRFRKRNYHRASPYSTDELTFDVARTGRTFSGTCKIGSTLEVKGKQFPLEAKVAGRLVTFEGNTLHGAEWPAFGGPSRTMVVAGPELVDSLEKARPVWRSEGSVPVSYGGSADMRYAGNARASGAGGGSSSPVVAGGVVYQGFYRPNPDSAMAVPDWVRQRQWKGQSLDAFTADWLPAEKTDLQDFFRQAADDHVVAIDARTGRTLWETVWPKRSYNYQTHKHRGLFGVPLVADGKVFYPNLHGHLMAMDAKTGKPLWEYPEFGGTPKPRGGGFGGASEGQSPLLIGKTLIWCGRHQLVGLSPEDGSVRWTSKLKGQSYLGNMLEVDLGGKPYVLTSTGWLGQEAALLDPSDGKVLWRQGARFGWTFDGRFAAANEALVAGDRLVAFRLEKKPKGYVRLLCWRISLEGLEQLWESETMPRDESPSMAIAGGTVYAVGRRQVRCIDLETGTQTGTLPQAPAGSNPYLVIAGGKALLSPEGQHGHQSFLLYRLADGAGKLLGDAWHPPNPSTTAYAGQPVVHPLVDGRLFVRGADGIYCYDLRKPAESE